VGGYNIHNNHFHDFANWDSPSNTYHHDGIHLWGEGGATITGGSIYSNTFDGDFGVNITAHVFLQESVQHVNVYNNTFVTPQNRTIQSVEVYASSTSMPGGPATGNSVYNNSINAGAHRAGSAIWAQNQLSFTAVNNILSGGVGDISIQGGTRSSAGINNNVYRDLFAEFSDRNTFGLNGHAYYTLSSWRTACHCDSASKLITGAQTTAFSAVVGVNGAAVAGAGVTSADPSAAAVDVNLAVLSAPTTTDPEMELFATVGEGNGINLSDIAVGDLAPLALDQNGKPRPTAGPWNVGPF
jgi:hypothetical protein